LCMSVVQRYDRREEKTKARFRSAKVGLRSFVDHTSFALISGDDTPSYEVIARKSNACVGEIIQLNFSIIMSRLPIRDTESERIQ